MIINSQMQPERQPDEIIRVNSRSEAEQLSLSRGRNFSQNMETLGMLTRRVSSEHPDLFAGMSNAPMLPQRQESQGNIFTGFHNDYEPVRPTAVRANMGESYAMECLEYEKYLFDNRIRLIIKKMSVHSYNIFRNEK